MFSKHRLEALSDGVFAIAMTLLILEIKVPLDTAPGTLWPALRHEGHEWISFVVSFAIAAVFWTLQHRTFDLLKEIGAACVALTFVTLGLVSVLPFSTSLWGHHINEPLAFLFYFGNQFLIAAVLVVKVEISRRAGHVRQGRATDSLRLKLWTMSAVMGTAALGTLILPLKFISFVPLVLGLGARRLRSMQKARWARLDAMSAPK